MKKVKILKKVKKVEKMECAMCFEQFIQFTSDKDLLDKRNEYMKKSNNNNIKFLSLLLLPDQKPKYACKTNECNKYFCDDCYENKKCVTKIFQCNYCNTCDYKEYMLVNVLRELQIKVLGEEAHLEWCK
jgi:hypothetical protein